MSDKITWTNERRIINGSQRNNLPNVICSTCGKPFHVKPCALRRGRGQYCSWECRYKDNRVNKICIICGKEFILKKSHDINGNGKYCSQNCYGIDIKNSGRYIGATNPNYKDGQCYTPEYVCRHSHKRRTKIADNGGCYTPNEWIELCNKYGNRCLACGRTDAILTVDHIVPIKLGGTNNIGNIQPLCKSCNSKKNAKVIDYREALS